MSSNSDLSSKTVSNGNASSAVQQGKTVFSLFANNANNTKSPSFECTKCAYTCISQSILASHMKTHTDAYRMSNVVNSLAQWDDDIVDDEYVVIQHMATDSKTQEKSYKDKLSTSSSNSEKWVISKKKTLAVFNVPKTVSEEDLKRIFAKYGSIQSIIEISGSFSIRYSKCDPIINCQPIDYNDYIAYHAHEDSTLQDLSCNIISKE